MKLLSKLLNKKQNTKLSFNVNELRMVEIRDMKGCSLWADGVVTGSFSSSRSSTLAIGTVSNSLVFTNILTGETFDLVDRIKSNRNTSDRKVVVHCEYLKPTLKKCNIDCGDELDCDMCKDLLKEYYKDFIAEKCNTPFTCTRMMFGYALNTDDMQEEI